ncbi:MAG: hypothetical protein ACOYMA_12945 [Bacteroidia bacterium]
MKKINSLFVLLFLSFVGINAQNVATETLKTPLVPSKYNRNALTVVILDNNGSHIREIKRASDFIAIPEKYDDNNLDVRVIQSESNKDMILQNIDYLKLSNQILAKSFSRKSTGEFDMTLIGKRGMYNATGDDMIKASASKKGLENIKDAGKALVNNSYIQVLDIRNVISMEEYYNKQDAINLKNSKTYGTQFKPVERTKNGWKGEVVSYLYKIDSNAVDTLYDKMWIYNDDNYANKISKKELFDKSKFGFSFVMTVTADADGTQYNPGQLLAPKVQLTNDELFVKLTQSALVNSLFVLDTKYEPFRVKTSVYAINPVRSKIGTKEGLFIDQRFFILENVGNSKGEIVSKRKAVVRVSKIANNSQISTANDLNMSDFYQTAGRSIEKGMTMQQRNDKGFGVSVGSTMIGGMGGITAKVEKNSGLSPQLKAFIAGAIDAKQYDGYNYAFLRYQVGVSQGFYFARNFSVAPFIAYGVEGAPEDETLSLNTRFINFGAYATINILHNCQLVGTANYYLLSGNAYYYDSESKESSDAGLKYNEFFVGRSGLAIELSLRIEL